MPTDPPSMAIDFRGMCKRCVATISNAHGSSRKVVYCNACRTELRQADVSADAARTWYAVPKEQPT